VVNASFSVFKDTIKTQSRGKAGAKGMQAGAVPCVACGIACGCGYSVAVGLFGCGKNAKNLAGAS